MKLQPSIKGTAACNVLVPAAILITGNSYSSFVELFDVMNRQALSTRQCYSVQRRYIIPKVEEMWQLHNTAVIYEWPLFFMHSLFFSYEARRLNFGWMWRLLPCWTCDLPGITLTPLEILLLLCLTCYYSEPFICCLRQTNMIEEVKEQLLAVKMKPIRHVRAKVLRKQLFF